VPSDVVAPLLELSARVVKRCRISIRSGSIPQHLEGTYTSLAYLTFLLEQALLVQIKALKALVRATGNAQCTYNFTTHGSWEGAK
jgi:hypothetical protein